jgi:hypothetical protein
MLRGIRGQRKATKEAHHAKGNDGDAERQTNPLQYVGHLHLGIFLEVDRGQVAIGSSSKPERWPGRLTNRNSSRIDG